jgi:cytidine deaminase
MTEPHAPDLDAAARAVREQAHAPYSRFKVGAAIRAASGRVHVGCNVENASYPEGTCAEAGAIAAMVAAGDTAIAAVHVIADAPGPVAPCGGCRQRIAEFAGPDVPVTMANLRGDTRTMTMAELLPGAFVKSDLPRD